jgi:integrase
MAKQITEKAAKRTKRIGIHWDTTTGLGLKVTHAGRKIWLLQTIYPGQHTPARRTLGSYPSMGLAEARTKAVAWYALVKQGIDPRDVEAGERKQAQAQRHAQAAQAANTFAAYCEKYISERKNRRAKLDAAEIRRLLAGAWGDLSLHEITPRHIRETFAQLIRRSPYNARNCWGHAVGIFKQAVHDDLIPFSPLASVDKRIVFKNAQIEARQRVLNDQELFAFWRAAGRLGYPFGPLYKLLCLTACRVSELSDARWSELHPELRAVLHAAAQSGQRVNWSAVPPHAKVLTVPRERFKSDVEHPVMLSDDALQIIEALPRWSGGDFLFTTTSGRLPVSSLFKAKRKLDARMLRTLRAMARMRGEDPEQVKLAAWVTHDLRRAARSNLAALRVDDGVAEMVLGHAKRGLQRIYDRHKYESEIREALQRWAQRLAAIVAPATPTPETSNIVTLRQAK